jgi:hypothetical protein
VTSSMGNDSLVSTGGLMFVVYIQHPHLSNQPRHLQNCDGLTSKRTISRRCGLELVSILEVVEVVLICLDDFKVELVLPVRIDST